jgi:protein-disulfide isomerase
MAERRKRKNAVSWELIGIMAVLAVFVVGFLFWFMMPKDRIVAPAFSSLDPDYEGNGDADAVIATGAEEDGRPSLGSPDAPVTLYEFADFQCPHCRDFATKMAKELKADYLAEGKARLIWVNAPFGGPESDDAAIAALCAGEQGLFWPMHDYLFANQANVRNQGGFALDRLLDMGEAIGADTTTLRACIENPEMLDRIADDRAMVDELAIDSTPSFVVGETKIVGGDAVELARVLDEAIAAAEID